MVAACSSPSPTPSVSSPPPAQEPKANETAAVEAPTPTPPPPLRQKSEAFVIDPVALEKSTPLFEALVRNDEKKVKVAYGRAVRVLPELVQFAFDLRLKNYEHALNLLDRVPLTDSYKVFWRKVLDKKPVKLNKAVCDDLAAESDFPSGPEKPSELESAWIRHFDEVALHLINPAGAPREPSELTLELSKVSCGEKECGPLSEGLSQELLTDSFFDKLHNMRRRDTRFYAANIKNIMKLGQYQPLVADMALFKFYKSLKISESTKQQHFLRRFKGIARDMRSDTILSRSVADIIMGEDKDLIMAKRFGHFLTSHPMIAAITRIEGELPSCHVPYSAPPAPPAPKPTAVEGGASPEPSP